MYSSTAAAVLRRAELSLSGEGRQQKKNLFSAVNQPREIIRLSSSPFFFPKRERERENLNYKYIYNIYSLPKNKEIWTGTKSKEKEEKNEINIQQVFCFS
jgi:hypothetical protein